METHGLKERYAAVTTLKDEGFSNAAIGRKIGLSRAATQRLVWLSQLPADIRDSYLDGGFAENRIFRLWRLRSDEAALRSAFQGLCPKYRRRRICRTESEVRNALMHMSNPLVIRTLLWIVGETPTLA